MAAIYDQRWTRDFAKAVFSRCLEILKREGVKPGVLVDLACGTGRLANLFAAKGWSVTGVDISKEMLALAAENSRKERLKVEYVRDDIRKWSKANAADLVTCTYDSLNHLTTKSDLQKVFRNAYRTLKPGGIFLFDINHEDFYKNYWNGRAEFYENKDFSLAVQLSYSAKQSLGQIDATAFLRKGKTYERVQEVVVEKMFTGSEVARLLSGAKFGTINAERFDPFELPYKGVIKTFWSAKKDPT